MRDILSKIVFSRQGRGRFGLSSLEIRARPILGDRPMGDLLHPTDETLRAYGLGKLDEGSAEGVDGHLERCPDCRRRVAAMSSDSFLERVRDAQKGSSKPSGLPVAGTLS